MEDSPVNRRVTLRILERLGFAPEAVANGAAALERLDRQTYDVVLMDCQMPELDGYSATRELRRRETGGRHTLIIGVTANALTGDREACLAAGMDDFLAKPVSPEDLAAMLEKWLRQSPLF